MMHRRTELEIAPGARRPRTATGASAWSRWWSRSITLVGIAMIPLMIAARSLVSNSSYTRNSTRVETTLSNAPIA